MGMRRPQQLRTLREGGCLHTRKGALPRPPTCRTLRLGFQSPELVWHSVTAAGADRDGGSTSGTDNTVLSTAPGTDQQSIHDGDSPISTEAGDTCLRRELLAQISNDLITHTGVLWCQRKTTGRECPAGWMDLGQRVTQLAPF